MKILVVEDDFISRQVLVKILSKHGACDIAVNGKEALEAARMAMESKSPYDMVCLDIMMPEMDGLEALRKLREIESEQGLLGLDGAKVIMVTALSDAKNVVKAFKSQCESYVVKPITRAKIETEMRKLNLIH